ncbi:chromosome segregation ATPase [Desulfocicer vacuolatum DSM 3385]|uniref:Chromosome segregation ATPase n=1 Tax=Desulfocicer vacuolatum DSM 3385 TaxID=1121400 RepID=A0A1W2BIQ8_9BACT|nr:chromosome segregation ATPase [Desulfocicer vacuolatum DSM 3385]
MGKTTTAVNLAAALAVSGKETLLVDCDPQANATTATGIDKPTLGASLYHGLIGDETPQSLICDTETKKLKILPSNVDLIGFEVELMDAPQRERVLNNLLSKISHQFQYIIIDCPPSLSLLTLNALTAAHSVLIPLQSEFFALEGLGQLLETIKRVKVSLNPGLRIEGILLTMFDKRTNLARQVVEDAEKYFKEMIFKTKIPRNVKLAEAPSYGMPVISYDLRSPGASSYLALAKELLNR